MTDERVRQRGHDQLSVFGIVEGEDAVLLQPLSRALQARGALVSTEHGGLALGGDARAILKGDKRSRSSCRPNARGAATVAGGAVPRANPVGDPLFEALRDLRRDLASEAQIPPYVIFHDATLREMAKARPANLAQFGQIGGVGAKKLDAYGDAFLAVIRQH